MHGAGRAGKNGFSVFLRDVNSAVYSRFFPGIGALRHVAVLTSMPSCGSRWLEDHRARRVLAGGDEAR